MYILAILRNIKSIKLLQYKFYGKEPNSQECENTFKESGFYKYVKTTDKDFNLNTNKIQIISGDNVDTNIAAMICDFVNEICKTKTVFTKGIYETIIELMTNTVQHAYKNKEVLFVNHWYMFVENKEDKIQFIFLDTGEGIPSTIHKKINEKMFGKNDSKLIVSALRGEDRSETKSPNRGKGLPSISENCLSGVFDKLEIYSGTGCCKVSANNTKKYELIDNEENLFGTLFSWEIDKNKIGVKYKI